MTNKGEERAKEDSDGPWQRPETMGWVEDVYIKHIVQKLMNGLYDYIIITCVSDASSRVVLSFLNHLLVHLYNESQPLVHSSCRRARCRSPSSPSVTSCSASRQHTPLAALLLRRLRTLCTAHLAHNNRFLLQLGSNQPDASSVSATEEEVQLPQR